MEVLAAGVVLLLVHFAEMHNLFAFLQLVVVLVLEELNLLVALLPNLVNFGHVVPVLRIDFLLALLGNGVLGVVLSLEFGHVLLDPFLCCVLLGHYVFVDLQDVLNAAHDGLLFALLLQLGYLLVRLLDIPVHLRHVSLQLFFAFGFSSPDLLFLLLKAVFNVFVFLRILGSNLIALAPHLYDQLLLRLVTLLL